MKKTSTPITKGRSYTKKKSKKEQEKEAPFKIYKGAGLTIKFFKSKKKRIEEDPFLKITHPDGSTEWEMSSDVDSKQTEWAGRLHEYCDEEVFHAFRVIRHAERRSCGDKYMHYPSPEDEFGEAYRRFIVPIAQRLNGIEWASHEEAERMKKEALHWVSLVLNESFPPLDLKARRVLGLIETARRLCQEHDRLPLKKELWSAVRRRDPKTFTVGEDTERNLLKMAGLHKLPQARRGGK
jgi:hypothetical protein